MENGQGMDLGNFPWAPKAKPTQKRNSWVGKKIAMKKKNYHFYAK